MLFSSGVFYGVRINPLDTVASSFKQFLELFPSSFKQF